MSQPTIEQVLQALALQQQKQGAAIIALADDVQEARAHAGVTPQGGPEAAGWQGVIGKIADAALTFATKFQGGGDGGGYQKLLAEKALQVIDMNSSHQAILNRSIEELLVKETLRTAMRSGVHAVS